MFSLCSKLIFLGVTEMCAFSAIVKSKYKNNLLQNQDQEKKKLNIKYEK